MIPEFVPFQKIPRLSRECTITEKIDGTNGCIFIDEDGLSFLVGSRTRWITNEDDNFGFAQWAYANKDELLKLGPGRHFGEWWGLGIQRKYGQDRKRFSLFNTHKWSDSLIRPKCCDVVPELFNGLFSESVVLGIMDNLRSQGSRAAPGFKNPEGIIIYHHALGGYFKKTLDKDDEWKGKVT